MTEWPTSPAAYQSSAQATSWTSCSSKLPRWYNAEINGSRRSINPTLAGRDNSNTPRKEAASEARISSTLPSACWAEKVGMAAIAIDWAMATWAMSISENP